MVTAIRSRLGLFAIEINIFSLGSLKNQVLLFYATKHTKTNGKMLHEFRQKDVRTGFGYQLFENLK